LPASIQLTSCIPWESDTWPASNDWLAETWLWPIPWWLLKMIASQYWPLLSERILMPLINIGVTEPWRADQAIEAFANLADEGNPVIQVLWLLLFYHYYSIDIDIEDWWRLMYSQIRYRDDDHSLFGIDSWHCCWWLWWLNTRPMWWPLWWWWLKWMYGNDDDDIDLLLLIEVLLTSIDLTVLPMEVLVLTGDDTVLLILMITDDMSIVIWWR